MRPLREIGSHAAWKSPRSIFQSTRLAPDAKVGVGRHHRATRDEIDIELVVAQFRIANETVVPLLEEPQKGFVPRADHYGYSANADRRGQALNCGGHRVQAAEKGRPDGQMA